MTRLIKLILSSVSLIIVMVINYLSNTEILGSSTVGEISNKYQTVITPAGYAFSIWGLIYLLLILFVSYQWYTLVKNKNAGIIDKTGYYFTLANLANSLWVVAWTSDLIGLSLVLILLLLAALVLLVLRLNLEMWDAPKHIIFFVWWPITIYFGWIILASVLNVSIFFVSISLDGIFLSPTMWGVLLIILSTAIYLFLIKTRNLREAALVGAWGLLAIAYRQYAANSAVTITALISAGILLIYTLFHAVKNRKRV